MIHVPDTNVCIRFLRNDPRVVDRWIEAATHIRLSGIVVAELEAGVARAGKAAHREQLNDLLATLPFEPFTLEDAREYGRLRTALEQRGQPIGPLDTLIAAQALRLGATVVTNNLREFNRVPGLKCEDWQAA